MTQKQPTSDAPPGDGHPAAHATAHGSTEGSTHGSTIERLYLDHNAALLRFLASRLGSHQEAKEIAQEAYVRLLSLHTPGAISYLRAFLYKTASNLALDRLRNRGRHGRLDEAYAASEALNFPAPPEEQTATAQEIERLRHALAELPPKCRKAFLLHKFHNLTMVEVARELQVTDRMVRLYMTRALLHCRKAMGADRDEEERP
jgi:RNA polymerase sigma-70 factor (ECF subfamily)